MCARERASIEIVAQYACYFLMDLFNGSSVAELDFSIPDYCTVLIFTSLQPGTRPCDTCKHYKCARYSRKIFFFLLSVSGTMNNFSFLSGMIN